MHIYIYTHIFIHGQYEVFIFSDLKDVFSYLINMPNLYCNHSHLYKIIGLFFILFFSLFLADKNKREKKKENFYFEIQARVLPLCVVIHENALSCRRPTFDRSPHLFQSNA